MRLIRPLAVGLGTFSLLLMQACGGASAVQYVDGNCLIGGTAATIAQVEARQALVTQHILSRQPILTAIAVAAVAIASASYLQRLLVMLAARRASDTNFAERVRARMERHRAHPLRYFSMLSGVFAILVMAGIAYVRLDADKRSSERALATLQFCHIALRTSDEQRVLGEQRANLVSIQSTAGDIRALVGKLPPAEQQKARDIVDQLTAALGQQRVLVTRYASQADESARLVVEHQAEVERGLSKLDGDVGDLKSMPAVLGKLPADLSAIDAHVGARTDALAIDLDRNATQLDTVNTRLISLQDKLDLLLNRPPPNCAPPMLPVAASAPATGPVMAKKQSATTAAVEHQAPAAAPSAVTAPSRGPVDSMSQSKPQAQPAASTAL